MKLEPSTRMRCIGDSGGWAPDLSGSGAGAKP
jgi:hypothetical protein